MAIQSRLKSDVHCRSNSWASIDSLIVGTTDVDKRDHITHPMGGSRTLRTRLPVGLRSRRMGKDHKHRHQNNRPRHCRGRCQPNGTGQVHRVFRLRSRNATQHRGVVSFFPFHKSFWWPRLQPASLLASRPVAVKESVCPGQGPARECKKSPVTSQTQSAE
jgi:hypothetical protein